ncbi:MAG: phenylalanine--tRNA ligase subunit beta [Frankiaceae bacterium]
MRVPLSWLREYADLPDVPAREIANRLIFAGLEVEAVEAVGTEVRGVRIGEVLTVEELSGFRKPVRYCTVEVGDGRPRGIVCGATNFAAGDRVPVALPGAVLPGGFAITARKTYGHLSDGMICSARELGVGEDHAGILVLPDSAEVGADAVDSLRLRDDVLDIAVTPDRGYCWSIRGVAREAALAFDVDFRDPASGPPPSCPPEPVPSRAEPGYEVIVADRRGCDRYVARTVTGLDPVARTPLEIQRRLLLAGMRPISLAVDVTNYVLLDLGQPLHAFDRSRLQGPIVVRRAETGERLRTLDGVERTVDTDDLVITDSSGPIALAGVMGGGPTEVSEATTDLVIEAAHFDPYVVARAARRHKLATEASKRFERGVDDALPAVAADAAVALLTEWGGAKEEPGVTDLDSRQPRPSIRLAPDVPTRVAGRPYDPDTVRRRLLDVGCVVTVQLPADARAFTVAAPSWRPDLTRAIDLADEVIRLEGYDTVPTALPSAPAGRGLTRRQRQRRRLGAAMAGAGYVETPTYPFTSAGVLDRLRLPADDPRRRTVELANPLDEGEPLLRTTLLPGLLTALARNVSRGFADLALFELGPVFLGRPDVGPAPRPPGGMRPDDTVLAALDGALPEQPLHLAVVLTGLRQPAGWWGGGRPAEWADAVQAGRRAGASLGVGLTARQAQRAPWHPGRCAELMVGDVAVGYAGEWQPAVLDSLELPARACAMELDVSRLWGLAGVGPADYGEETGTAPVISAYPLATVDIAVVVAESVPVAAVEAAVRAGAGELLEAIALFDVYRGAQVASGQKSLAFGLRLRAPDRTLTSAEVTAVRDAAVRAAAEATGAVLRGA